MSSAAFRLVKAKHAANAFSGDGARIAGGRWNLPGTSVVYASDSLSLAALETFVHLQPVDRRVQYTWFHITIPDSVEVETPATLPNDWRVEPPSDATQSLGSQWAEQNQTAVLRVPSILVPGEFNLLLNPSHAHFKRIKISGPRPFDFDGRLWKSGEK